MRSCHVSSFIIFTQRQDCKKNLIVGLLPKKTTWEAFMLDDEHTYRDRLGQHYGWMTIDRVYAFLNVLSDDFLKNNTFNTKEVFTDTYTPLKIIQPN